MRYVSRLLLGAILVLCVLGADVPTIPHSGTQADPDLIYASQSVALEFIDVYTADAVTIARIDVEVLSEAGESVTTWSLTTGWAIIDGMIRIPIRERAVGMMNGTYRLRARVWDTFGNVSDYSADYWVIKRWQALNRPGGCRTVP